MTEQITFRDTIRNIVPGWMQRGTIGKVIFTLGAHLDAISDMATEALLKRYPLPNSEDASSLLGEDRKIIRGVYEDWNTYASRLRIWRQSHQTRGGAYSLLRQLYAFWSGAFQIEIYTSGINRAYYIMGTDGNIARGTSSAWVVAGLSRWLLVYQWPDPLTDDGLWGDPGTWGDGGVWGSGLTPETVSNLRRVPAQWGNAHSIGRLRLAYVLNNSNFIELSLT